MKIIWKVVKQGRKNGESVFETIFEDENKDVCENFAKAKNLKIFEYTRKNIRGVRHFIRPSIPNTFKGPSVNICSWGGGTSIHRF